MQPARSRKHSLFLTPIYRRGYQSFPVCLSHKFPIPVVGTHPPIALSSEQARVRTGMPSVPSHHRPAPHSLLPFCAFWYVRHVTCGCGGTRIIVGCPAGRTNGRGRGRGEVSHLRYFEQWGLEGEILSGVRCREGALKLIDHGAARFTGENYVDNNVSVPRSDVHLIATLMLVSKPAKKRVLLFRWRNTVCRSFVSG